MAIELRRWIRRHDDWLVAAALTAIALLNDLLVDQPADWRVANLMTVLVLGAAAAVRVRAPLILLASMLVMTVAGKTVAGFNGATIQAYFFFFLLAIYNGAAHTHGWSTVAAAAMAVGIYVTDVLGDPQGITPDTVVFYAMLVGLPWAVGAAVRQRRAKEAQLEAERAEAAAAIVAERARIARELHDVVAHAISVMVIQARGGRRVLEAAPDESAEAFAAIERTGHEALDEMRRLLGMLRRNDDAVELGPQPSLRELDRLAEQIRDAGLPVELVVEGQPRDLPPGVEVSAYRIVQEALTNALKHAGPARARVVVRYEPDDLELVITDDGAGGPPPGTGQGFGLIGMRERVSVYGGELQAGRQTDGGYALRVRLPLGSVRA
jgi:signal transduction histidine kinase